MNHSHARPLPRDTTHEDATTGPAELAPTSARTHWHLWTLPVGTGLHAPHGELAAEDGTGRLCCHLCGRWFRSLGAHVRAHGHTADTYRDTMGLCRGTALTAAVLSAAVSGRQTEEYRRDPDLRARLAAGRAALRNRSAAPAPDSTSEPVQRMHRRRSALAAGRATTALRREQQLTSRLHQLGQPTLHDYLRTAYAAGASLETLARRTGLGRARLRQEIEDAGITVRPTGHNTAAGKRSRAQVAEAAAAERIGTEDLLAWLADRHAAGWPLTRLAAAVGHSTHWVRWRLPAGDVRPLVVAVPTTTTTRPGAGQPTSAHLMTEEATCGQ